MKYEDLADSGRKIVDFVKNNSSKQLERIMKDFIIFHEKHGDRFFKFSKIDEAEDVSIKILNERFDRGYFYKEDFPEEKITKEDINNLPEILKEEGEKRLKEYNRQIKDIETSNLFYDLAFYAIEQRNGLLAWWIIDNRKDYQYEGLEVDGFEKAN